MRFLALMFVIGACHAFHSGDRWRCGGLIGSRSLLPLGGGGGIGSDGRGGGGLGRPPVGMAAGGGDDDGSGGENDDVNRGNSEENDASQNPIKKQWLSLSSDNRDDIKTTSASFIFALLLRLFIIEPRFIPSMSMFPTFEVGDQLLVEKVSKVNRHYQRRDVVVFNPPKAYVDLTGNTEALIKRVVGVAGDSIEVKGKHLFINGVEQEEPFTNELPDYTIQKLTVPDGMVLVLGDNRNYSFDSHIWGFLPERNVIGRAVLKYWPPWRLGTVEGGL